MTGTALPQAPRYDDVVDLGRYPIDDPASPAFRDLVQACRDQLASRGVAQLAGFLTPSAVGQMLALVGQQAAQAWASDQVHTAYLEPADPSAGPDHPRALLQHSAKKAIAYDQIPAGAPIRRLYESDDLTGFIAAVLGQPALYRSADPLDALEIAIFSEGDELGWHFDNSEFSVTVMYQQAATGGYFDYCPGLRSEHDENYLRVQQVLQGDRDGVLRLPASPGTLAVFRGQHALHRVTPASGPHPRINSVRPQSSREATLREGPAAGPSACAFRGPQAQRRCEARGAVPARHHHGPFIRVGLAHVARGQQPDPGAELGLHV